MSTFCCNDLMLLMVTAAKCKSLIGSFKSQVQVLIYTIILVIIFCFRLTQTSPLHYIHKTNWLLKVRTGVQLCTFFFSFFSIHELNTFSDRNGSLTSSNLTCPNVSIQTISIKGPGKLSEIIVEDRICTA